jgi:hypothetical protein
VRKIAVEASNLADQARRHGLVHTAEGLIDLAFAVFDDTALETS